MNLYDRILLKLSGEALGGPCKKQYDIDFVNSVIDDLIQLKKQIAIVVGGGNIIRGSQQSLSRVCGDQMGMLATIMNGLFLQELFEKKGIKSVVMSVIDCPHLCVSYNAYNARELLEKGYIVICVGGTPAPYFTTDTAAIVRANEMNCDLVMKATKVNGVFSKDPTRYKDAQHYKTLKYQDVIENRLKVLDLTAIEIAKISNLKIVVFSIFNEHPVTRVFKEDVQFTFIN